MRSVILGLGISHVPWRGPDDAPLGERSAPRQFLQVRRRQATDIHK